jgi:hypothetical protein
MAKSEAILTTCLRVGSSKVELDLEGQKTVQNLLELSRSQNVVQSLEKDDELGWQ